MKFNDPLGDYPKYGCNVCDSPVGGGPHDASDPNRMYRGSDPYGGLRGRFLYAQELERASQLRQEYSESTGDRTTIYQSGMTTYLLNPWAGQQGKPGWFNNVWVEMDFSLMATIILRGYNVRTATVEIYQSGSDNQEIGNCSTCAGAAFAVGAGSFALDFRGTVTSPETYTDGNGRTGSVYKKNKSGSAATNNGKPVFKSRNAASHYKSAKSIGSWGTLFNLAGTYFSFKSARDSGWQSRETSDLAAGLLSFVPNGGWVASAMYFAVQSNTEMVEQGIPMQYTPMVIIPGLGPAPVVRN